MLKANVVELDFGDGSDVSETHGATNHKGYISSRVIFFTVVSTLSFILVFIQNVKVDIHVILYWLLWH